MVRGAFTGFVTGGAEEALIGGAGSIRAVGAVAAGLAGAGVEAFDQFREGRVDPCFQIDFRRVASSGLSASAGTLLGGATGIVGTELFRNTTRNTAREAFRQGSLPANRIREVINGASPTSAQQIGGGIGAAGVGAFGEGLVNGPSTESPSGSSSSCGGCE